MAEPGAKDALCSKCGQSVEQRKMIPVLGPDGAAAHVCVDCARGLIPDDYEDPSAPDSAVAPEPPTESAG